MRGAGDDARGDADERDENVSVSASVSASARKGAAFPAAAAKQPTTWERLAKRAQRSERELDARFNAALERHGLPSSSRGAA